MVPDIVASSVHVPSSKALLQELSTLSQSVVPPGDGIPSEHLFVEAYSGLVRTLHQELHHLNGQWNATPAEENTQSQALPTHPDPLQIYDLLFS